MLNSTLPCCEWKHIPHTYAFPGQSDMHVPCTHARFYIMSWFYWKHISVSTLLFHSLGNTHAFLRLLVHSLKNTYAFPIFSLISACIAFFPADPR